MSPALEELRSDIERHWAEVNDQGKRSQEPAWVQAAFAVVHRQDQAYRELYKAAMVAGEAEELARLRPVLLAADAENRRWLKNWLETNPWPIASVYGEEAATAAWLVCLHSDVDVAFQREMFLVLTELFERGEISAVHYAGLHDRIAINEDRPQLWGMFFHLDGTTEVAYEVERPEELADRRSALGLTDERFHR